MAQCKLMDKKELVRLNAGKRVRFEIQDHLCTRVRKDKTCFVFYYHVEGKKNQREMVLGTFPDMTLSKANQLARKYNAMLDEGKDPLNVCRCNPVKDDKKKNKKTEKKQAQLSLFTVPLESAGKILKTKKKEYTIHFNDKAEYEHFLALVSTIESTAEDLSSYMTELRKLIK